MQIQKMTEWPSGFQPLEDESLSDGFRFLQKMRREWESGDNRFDREGEMVFGAFDREKLIGIGGLNRDPYANEATVGRIRHLYVLREYRKRGVGAALVREIILKAKPQFSKLRLRTDTLNAAKFYESIGFRPVVEDSATHQLEFSGKV